MMKRKKQTKQEREAQRVAIAELRREQKAVRARIKEQKAEEKAARRAMANLDEIETKKLVSEKFAPERRARSRSRTLMGAIPIEHAFTDGIWEMEPGLWSASMSFNDIYYQHAPYAARVAILTDYARMLNSFGQDSTIELTLVNRKARSLAGDDHEFYKVEDDVLGPHAEELNRILNDQLTEGVANLVRERYMTITTGAEDYKEAKRSLMGMVSSARETLADIHADAELLDGAQRLAAIQKITRPGADFGFDYDEYVYAGGPSPKEAILPSQIDFQPTDVGNYFHVPEEGIYGCVLAFDSANYGTLEDACLAEIVSLDTPLVVSVHLQPVSMDRTLADIRAKRNMIDSQVIREQQKAYRGAYSQAIISEAAQNAKIAVDEAATVMRHSEEEQHEFVVSGVVMVWADSLEGLKSATEKATRASGRYGIKLVQLDHMQLEGYQTALPLGIPTIPYSRRFFTHQAALLAPFANEEIWEEGGAYVGQNYNSKNLTFIARWKLSSPGGFVFGKPGSGKSFCMKQDITNIALIFQQDAERRARERLGKRASKARVLEYAHEHPTAELIIIDVKKSEYSPLMQAFGDRAEEVTILPSIQEVERAGGVFVNPLDLPYWMQLVSGENPISTQTELMMALFGEAREDDTVMKATQKTIIDRCVRNIYAGFEEISGLSPEDLAPDKMPTFQDLHDELMRQNDPEATELAKFLELYTTGSFNAFSHHSTFEFTKNITSFNVSKLGNNMRTFTMLVLLNMIMNRVYYNNERGVRTFVWIDEVQALFTRDYVVNYFEKFWSEGRAFGMVPTGMSQNIERVLSHDTAKYMVKNSGYLMLFEQADDEFKALKALLELPDTVAKNMAPGVRPGRGLVRSGPVTVPIEGNIPKTSSLYKLWDTEADEMLEQKRAEFLGAKEAQSKAKPQTRKAAAKRTTAPAKPEAK